MTTEEMLLVEKIEKLALMVNAKPEPKTETLTPIMANTRFPAAVEKMQARLAAFMDEPSRKGRATDQIVLWAENAINNITVSEMRDFIDCRP